MKPKRLPRYPTLPAVRIGRLAVHQRFQGRGLGGALLMDAARRSLQSPPAVYALLVDAKNDQAVGFLSALPFPTGSRPASNVVFAACHGRKGLDRQFWH